MTRLTPSFVVAWRMAVATALLLASVVVASAEVIDRVMAVVAGQIITKSDVDAAAALGFAGNLQELIDRTLMLSEVRRVSPPDPPASALDARVARVRGKFPTPEAYDRALRLAGVDAAAVRSYAADDLRLSTYLDERFSSAAQPSDEELRQAGEAARAQLVAERRQTLVNAWIAELRRRSDITVLP